MIMWNTKVEDDNTKAFNKWFLEIEDQQQCYANPINKVSAQYLSCRRKTLTKFSGIFRNKGLAELYYLRKCHGLVKYNVPESSVNNQVSYILRNAAAHDYEQILKNKKDLLNLVTYVRKNEKVSVIDKLQEKKEILERPLEEFFRVKGLRGYNGVQKGFELLLNRRRDMKYLVNLQQEIKHQTIWTCSLLTGRICDDGMLFYKHRLSLETLLAINSTIRDCTQKECSEKPVKEISQNRTYEFMVLDKSKVDPTVNDYDVYEIKIPNNVLDLTKHKNWHINLKRSQNINKGDSLLNPDQVFDKHSFMLKEGLILLTHNCYGDIKLYNLDRAAEKCRLKRKRLIERKRSLSYLRKSRRYKF